MNYTLSDIARICNGTLHGTDKTVKTVVTDSRKYIGQKNACFFAIDGPQRSGAGYIEDMQRAGITGFVASSVPKTFGADGSGLVLVDSPLEALQKLASHHRLQFDGKVIAVTGSYGKTIVKEWLYHVLSAKFRVFRSPKSWNSQLGVPLSLLLLNNDYDFAIIEAGISKPGEMSRLQSMIRPDFGIFTNSGNAHIENFSSTLDKAQEKAVLFQTAQKVIYDANDADVSKALVQLSKAEARIIEKVFEPDGCRLTFDFLSENYSVFIPFKDTASLQNAMLVGSMCLCLGCDKSIIMQRMATLPAVALRQEMIPGRFGSLIINDSWHSDPSGLGLVLEMAKQVAADMPIALFLSDIQTENSNRAHQYQQMNDVIRLNGVSKVFLIGTEIRKFFHVNAEVKHFDDTQQAILALNAEELTRHCVIIRGARRFQLERLVAVLAEKSHKTRLEINMSAIQRNLTVQRSALGKDVKLMAMLKAFAYGLGPKELARLLSMNLADYVGVAFAQEGVHLRTEGVHIPIMVMDTDALVFDEVIKHRLEPVIFSSRILNDFLHYLIRQGIQGYPIHVELNTGMNRLGFSSLDLQELCDNLITQPEVRVVSVFSHLAAADNPIHDEFTRNQITQFGISADLIEERLGYGFARHILNTHGIARFPEASFNMVRTGIGLYTGELGTVKLITTITQVRQINSGESVGYDRSWVAQKATTVAVLPIGYADGFRRTLSNGVGEACIHGVRYPVIGNVCMDLTMIDITGSTVKEGDEVEIFGEQISLVEFAEKCNTIQYEVLASVSSRVSRVYLWE